MARRRKAEAKAPPKQQPKSSAVRKSSRQRAKKQLEETKINGDILPIDLNSAEDCKDSDNCNSQESTKRVNAVPKKSARFKNLLDKEKSAAESANSQGGESDSQDYIKTDSPPHQKLENIEERQLIASESNLSEVIWPEDIIEETIICEEMEVEAEMTDGCSIAQDGSVVLEQVLLMNDPNFEGKDVVEYTVIQSEDGTESMMVSSDNVENIASIDNNYKTTDSYQMIEQGLSVLHMTESEIMEPLDVSESVVITENDKGHEASSYEFNNFDNCKSDGDSLKKECRPLRSVAKSAKGARTKKTINACDVVIKRESDSSRKKKPEATGPKMPPLDDKLLCAGGKDKTAKSNKKAYPVVSTNVIEQNNTQHSMALQQNQGIVALARDYDSASSVGMNKREAQEILQLPLSDGSKDEKIVNNSMSFEQKSTSTNPVDTKATADIINRLPAKSKSLLFSSEEHSRDSEIDGKMDSEDTKLSSSSENSNDTLLSSLSCKVSDFNADTKSTINQLNELEKKPGFRSRSGSTDTTGSESGSNSSGVRRSNRIRTIGLMKQRSRGRGLVTKPCTELAKISSQQQQQQQQQQQDRDKLISSGTSPVQEKDPANQSKDNLDNMSETQSDKENNSNKTTAVSQDILTPLITASGTTGYDSDSNKPVKVKSRWRRSSELEMSNSGCWSAPRPSLGYPNIAVSGAPVAIVPSTLSDLVTKLPSLPAGALAQESKSVMDMQDVVHASPVPSSRAATDTSVVSDSVPVANNPLASPSTTFIPKTIGAKISLPMVPTATDREMEERLSQFEHLKENLYLTERYTSKETKRMVCDCFLTEEEFQRGELGCGEDCLNRLLMIECGSRCVVGNRCTNKRFQNCEYANCDVFRTEKKGFGLKSTCDLNAGEFIMEYVGEVVDPKDFRKRAKEYSKDKNRHYYFMALKSDQIIDATMKGNVSRFINHSCDPNAETQKWTVNGELRIGFFSKKFITAGDEITFDYHFQRYGKEAQKCYCEAVNCRGWIGDNPEDNKEKMEYTKDVEDVEDDSEDDVEDKDEQEEENEEKPEKQIRRKREEKKVTEHMEDEDLEEQIDKLCSNGLKNRAHTLTLSRLMVRSRELQHRTRLLKVIQSGEQPCRRLFLDYHGLRLMWSYMMDVAGSVTDETQQFRLEILKTLSKLPIPNRTMLIDSKVLNVIEKWSKQLYHSPSGDSPEDDQSKLKSGCEETEIDNSEKTNIESILNNDNGEIKKETDTEIKSEIKMEVVEQILISELASNLLLDWSNLKEVFRIPKKERIEQMKEHEREADRGYKEDVEKEAKEMSSYERHRYSRNELEKRLDRRRGRDSPDFEHSRAKDKRALEERPNLVPVPRMSKFERRQLFAMKVAKEEEERQRRQQEDSWQQHKAQCLALGLDPFTTAAFDPQSGYPLFFNPQLGQWQAYPMQEGGADLAQQCASVYMGAAGAGQALANPAQAATMLVAGPVYPAYGQLQVGPAGLVQIHNGVPVPYPDKRDEPRPVPPTEPEPVPQPEPAPPPPLDLPPKWKWARDKRGRIYYYHAKERVSQWLPPPPDHIAVQPDSSTSSESSGESSETEEDEETAEEQIEPQPVEGMDLDPTIPEVQQPTKSDAPAPQPSSVVVPETKKRREGLVQERIISPRREEDRVDHKKYKEIKEKLRRQKERAKLKEHFEKMKKHRRSNKSKSHAKHSTSKFQSITSDMSPTMERKIKDTFRINMANVMVHFLNPYRKGDCKQGRITNTEDFKHLARKLTHFVLAKELKHCKSVDELECNDNVKHKAKDFVRKYMSKFGAVYQKGTDED